MADGTCETNPDSITEQPLPTPRRHSFLPLAFPPLLPGDRGVAGISLGKPTNDSCEPNGSTDQKTWRLDMCWDEVIFLPEGQHT